LGGSDLVCFDHLQSLAGSRGLYEHARLLAPRIEHGYSLDDNGRALVVLARAGNALVSLPDGLLDRCLGFVLAAADGSSWRDRAWDDGTWAVGASGDAVGRALWGLGAVAATENRDRPLDLLLEGVSTLSSPWWRPYAYAILGLQAAAEADVPVEADAWRRLAAHLPRPAGGEWRWPEPRLAYDNARLPEALLAASTATGDRAMADDGLRLLEWLIEEEGGANGFSFTPAGGRGPGDPKPGFDQQPIEAWAMADAAAGAARATGDAGWLEVAAAAADWLTGANDRSAPLYDPGTGVCFDGLTDSGVNLNAGAESTLSALGTLLAGPSRSGQSKPERSSARSTRPIPTSRSLMP
jgi:hypothetical protein